jgi:hypothetical protein
VVFDHPRDTQVLEYDHAKTIDQLPALLMGKVLASVGYSFMDTCDNPSPPDSFWCSLRLFTQAALRSFQVVLVATKEARVVNRLARRECRKLLQSDIHADGRFVSLDNCTTLPFNRKGDKPLSSAAAAQRDGFNPALDRTMQIDQHRADLREDEPVPFESCAIAVLRVGHTVISPKALETRVASVLFAHFDTTKEGLEGQIDPNLDVLQDLGMHELERTSHGFPVREHGLSVIQPKRFLTPFMGITARRKGLVVDPAAFLKLLLKKTLLAFGQMQAVLICGFTQFVHMLILTYNRIERTCYPCLPVAYNGFSATAFIPGLKARGFLPPFL